MEKKFIVIGNGPIPRTAIREILDKCHKDTNSILQTCKRCGSPNNILLNGYCIDCDEELELQANKRNCS